MLLTQLNILVCASKPVQQSLCAVFFSADPDPRGQTPPQRSIKTHGEPSFDPKDGEETGALAKTPAVTAQNAGFTGGTST